ASSKHQRLRTTHARSKPRTRSQCDRVAQSCQCGRPPIVCGANNEIRARHPGGKRDAPKGEPMPAKNICTKIAAAAVVAGLALTAPSARAADRHFTFGYDQPHTTAYGYAADVFAAKLKELSNGAMIIDQFPGAQLGQEPQMLQKV